MSHIPLSDRPRFTLARLWRMGVEAVQAMENSYRRNRAADKLIDNSKIRIFAVGFFFSLIFLALAYRAVRVALFNHPAQAGAETNEMLAARADLVDRNGRLLAIDVPRFDLYLDSRDVWDAAEVRNGLLRALPSIPRDRLDQALKAGRREVVLSGLTKDERDRVHDLGFQSVSFEETPRRFYPLGADVAHLVGFSDSGGRGRAGVERALDGEIRDAVRGGGQLPLAVDLRVQAALVEELRRAVQQFQAVGAAGVVTNVHTGEVLALASLPDYDPNSLGAASDDAKLNRAAGSDYEMGSTFKIFTFSAGLDSGAASLSSIYDATHPLQIGNRIIHDHDPQTHPMTLEQAFEISSNIAAAKLGLSVGANRLRGYLKSFGLLDAPSGGLPESRRPLLPPDWSESTTASVTFGQSIAVTPLAVAAAAGAVANGGTYVPLSFNRLSPEHVPAGHRVISPETARTMLSLMRTNVIQGTGKKADAFGLRVGGKTGSAQKAENGRYLDNTVVASFVAVFPADGALEAPRYLVLILLDQPKGQKETFGFRTAGWNAAPTAGKVIDRIAGFLNVTRAPATALADPAKTAVPIAEAVSEAPR
ncbi:MAG: penicillin-binding protein 2 [Pseudomonadota bacterium]